MTLPEIADALRPLALAALHEEPYNVTMRDVGAVLAALLGAIDGDGPPDADRLLALAATARGLCAARDTPYARS